MAGVCQERAVPGAILTSNLWTASLYLEDPALLTDSNYKSTLEARKQVKADDFDRPRWKTVPFDYS